MADDGGVRVESEEQFRDWLGRRKPSRDIIVALGARAALRALPSLVDATYSLPAGQLSVVVAFSFRAIALAWVVASHTRRAEDMSSASASAASAVAAVAFTARSSTTFAGSAYSAADASGWAAASVDADETYMDASDSSAFAVAASAVATGAALWSALTDDLRAIEAGGALSNRPLWPGGAPETAAENWKALVDLLRPEEHWRVWIDWYEARLKGEVWSEARELIYASVPEERWELGPAAANAWISEQLGALQNPIGSQFTRGPDGRIDIVPDPPTSEPASEAEQRETYDEMQFLAGQLAELGENVLGALAKGAKRLAASLDANYADASTRRVYLAGNYMRQMLAAHDTAKSVRESASNPDPYPSPEELAPAVIAPLRSFVGAFNIFVTGDATAQKLEALGSNSAERTPIREALAAAAPVVEDIPPTVATDAARETLSEQIEAGAKAPNSDLGDKDRTVASQSLLNFVLEALGTSAGAVAKGAAAGVGKKLVEDHWPEIVEFVRRHADTITDFAHKVVPDPDKLHSIIQRIINLLS